MRQGVSLLPPQGAEPRRVLQVLSSANPPNLTKSGNSVSIWCIGVAAEVDHHGAGQNQDVVLAVGDVDTVAVGPGEVLLRDRRDLAAMPPKGVFIIEQASRCFEVVGAGDVDCELAEHEGEDVLADGGDDLAVAKDVVRRAPRRSLWRISASSLPAMSRKARRLRSTTKALPSTK